MQATPHKEVVTGGGHESMMKKNQALQHSILQMHSSLARKSEMPKSVCLYVICLLLLFITSQSYAAFKLFLPNNLSYLVENGSNSLNEHAFKDISADNKAGGIRLNLEGQQGFKRYTYGHTLNQKAKGNLYITAVMPADDTAPLRKLGVRYFRENLDDKSYDRVPTSIPLLKDVKFNEIQVGSLGSNVSVSAPGVFTPAESSQCEQPFELSIAAKSHVLWSEVRDVCFGDLDFSSPALLLDRGELSFKQRSSVAQESATLVLHFIPSDDSAASIVIHSSAGSVAAGGDNQVLDVMDITQIALLDTVQTFAEIARHAGVQEVDIISAQRRATGDSDQGFQILQTILQEKGDQFTSGYLALLCERANKKALATRIRTGNLSVSIEDQELQAQMSSIGQFISGPNARNLATHMKIRVTEAAQIGGEEQPGFQLLHKAFEQNLLGEFYASCEALKLEELPNQIQSKCPILHAAVMAQRASSRKAGGTVAAVTTLDRISMDGVNPDMMKVKLANRQVGRMIRKRNLSEDKKKLLAARIKQATGRDVSESDVASLDADNVFFAYKQEDFGEGFTVAKWLDFLNDPSDIDMLSFCRSCVNTFKTGEIDMNAEQWYRLAEVSVDDYEKTLKMLLARGTNLDSRSRMTPEFAHGGRRLTGGLGLQCESYDCKVKTQIEGSWGQKDGYWGNRVGTKKACKDLPTLEAELARLSIHAPYTFEQGK